MLQKVDLFNNLVYPYLDKLMSIWVLYIRSQVSSKSASLIIIFCAFLLHKPSWMWVCISSTQVSSWWLCIPSKIALRVQKIEPPMIQIGIPVSGWALENCCSRSGVATLFVWWAEKLPQKTWWAPKSVKESLAGKI